MCVIKTFVMGLAKWLSGRVPGKYGQGPWFNLQHQKADERKRKTGAKQTVTKTKQIPHRRIF